MLQLKSKPLKTRKRFSKYYLALSFLRKFDLFHKTERRMIENARSMERARKKAL
jgi:hypothetical protein